MMHMQKLKGRVAYPTELQALNVIINWLEDGDWRALFGEAYGAPLKRGHTLSLFVGPGYAALIRENALFTPTEDGLRFDRLCNYPLSSNPDLFPDFDRRDPAPRHRYTDW